MYSHKEAIKFNLQDRTRPKCHWMCKHSVIAIIRNVIERIFRTQLNLISNDNNNREEGKASKVSAQQSYEHKYVLHLVESTMSVVCGILLDIETNRIYIRDAMLRIFCGITQFFPQYFLFFFTVLCDVIPLKCDAGAFLFYSKSHFCFCSPHSSMDKNCRSPHSLGTHFRAQNLCQNFGIFSFWMPSSQTDNSHIV